MQILIKSVGLWGPGVLDGYMRCSRGERDENIDFLDALIALATAASKPPNRLEKPVCNDSGMTLLAAVGVLRSDAVYLNKGD